MMDGVDEEGEEEEKEGRLGKGVGKGDGSDDPGGRADPNEA